ncbi:HNH endonuclease family protein [Pseudarthrobacter siccitolerans]|uniref:HNH endonuclease family protein n=1 Tax=Pseudarthrobacter siccitolerans TaxID=861266 RepID=A0A024H3A6_9MICC|nr:HNH endonuclease signature motif containing protein [Pseudarthrobacter siccitolerans]CCQ46221.1 HNH endonuclease family protein [Pseudarthrobacter siccitolerans]
MYSLNPPSFTAADAYSAAVGTIKKKVHRSPYVASAAAVQARCDAFERLATHGQFDLAEGSDFDVAGLLGSAMVELYDKQFSHNQGTKAIRNGIKNAAKNALCPYCGEGYASELDHYLPKTKFAGTTVHPANLVPACGDCNFEKRAYKPGRDKPAVLHPYFDTAFNVPWLTATVISGPLGTPVVDFRVGLPQPYPELEARLNQHMTVFKLWKRFGTWAAQSLDNFETLLRTSYGQSMTWEGARKHLRLTALQQSGGRVNSWEGATHLAMLESDWYLSSYLKLA